MDMDAIFIKKRFTSNRGSVLMWAVVMSLCTMLIGTAYLMLATSFYRESEWDYGRVKNTYTHLSSMLLSQLAYVGKTPSGSMDITYWQQYYGTSSIGTGIRLNETGSQGLASWSDYKIWGIGETSCDNGGMVWKDSATYIFGVQSFADYLWLTNDEHDITTGDSILWWTPDTLDGRVHSNGYLFIHGTQNRPLFLKQVSTCKSDTKPPRSTYSANLVYKGGFKASAPRIIFPDQADSVRRYSYDRWLVGRSDSTRFRMYYLRFFSGNTFKILLKPRSSSFTFDTTMSSTPGVGWNAVPFIPMPPQGAVFVYGKLFIDAPYIPARGLLGIDGRLTIAAADSIIVLHNLVYKCSNTTTGKVPLGCDDALGLISEKYLLMSKNCGAALYPAPGALLVNGGLVALHGSMGCENVGIAPEFNSLMIHGSIAQLNRGVVHRGSAGFGTGFVQKDYFYDQRFAKSPPPHFVPTGNLKQYYIF
jgi:hypothetical protein